VPLFGALCESRRVATDGGGVSGVCAAPGLEERPKGQRRPRRNRSKRVARVERGKRVARVERGGPLVARRIAGPPCLWSIFEEAPFEIPGQVAGSRSPKCLRWQGRELASAAWAVAKLAPQSGPRVLAAVSREAPAKLAAFGPQEISNTAWAFATAGFPAPKLFRGMALAASAKVDRFKPQELSNLVWAFSKCGLAAPALFDAVAAHASKKMHLFKPQEVSNTVWAFATAGHAAPMLFDAVGREAPGTLHGFNAQVPRPRL